MSQKRTHPSGAEERGRREKRQDKGPSVSSTKSCMAPPPSVPTVSSMSATTADLPSFTSKSPSQHGLSPGPPVDPTEWPSFLSESDRTEQVIRGPLPMRENCFFPQKVTLRLQNIIFAQCCFLKAVNKTFTVNTLHTSLFYSVQ
ncbi:hypothetical protein AMECASPLE_033264 [Ameca splendens]|uniref:Uncharacterized protein n=1 Tax=Ameca splendens TaxID=208324 RepID=A0ABV0XVQ4_9TELE